MRLAQSSNWITTLVILFLSSCSGPTQDINAIAHPVHMDAFMAKKLTEEILSMRAKKDEFFSSSPNSPIPPALRPVFDGLKYYDIDWRYRFEGPVQRYPSPQRFQMITNAGELRDAIRYGYIRFRLQDQEFRLEVYRLLDLEEKNLLFVPFVDAAAGKETYDAGRYIDLEMKQNGIYVIDFNIAYNPYCAYGSDYVCPVTPQENHLPIAIPAGEKILPIAVPLERAKRSRS